MGWGLVSALGRLKERGRRGGAGGSQGIWGTDGGAARFDKKTKKHQIDPTMTR